MTTGIKAAEDKYTPYAAEGFSYYINTSASTPYAVIVGIPNQASVTLPPNVSYMSKIYPIKKIGFMGGYYTDTNGHKIPDCYITGAKVKELRYTCSVTVVRGRIKLPNDMVVYVPDSIMSNAISQLYEYKIVSDNGLYSLPYNVHPTDGKIMHNNYYDVNGDGIMEVIGTSRVNYETFLHLVSTPTGNVLDSIRNKDFKEFKKF